MGQEGSTVASTSSPKQYLKSLESFKHREPTQSVCVADCYFIVNVLDLPFALPIAIYC